MKADVKEKWLAALRSEQYQQGQYRLKWLRAGGPEHCCLGVLCEVLGVPERSTVYQTARFDFGGDRIAERCPPEDFMESLGIPNEVVVQLLSMNDGSAGIGSYSFKHIADYIEENL